MTGRSPSVVPAAAAVELTAADSVREKLYKERSTEWKV